MSKFMLLHSFAIIVICSFLFFIEANKKKTMTAIVWGMLKSQKVSMYNVYLKEEAYVFGRSDDGGRIDLNVQKRDHTKYISREQFTISRENDQSPAYITDKSINGTWVNGGLIGNGKKNILKTGDIIGILVHNEPVYKFTDHILPPTDFPKEITEEYFIGVEPIGKGGFGDVYKAYSWVNGDTFAIKKVEKIPLCEKETNIMKNLNHPCIVKLLNVIESTDAWFIRLNFLEGGSLDDRLKKGQLPEEHAKFFCYQIAKAVEYLHSLHIVHRDIKPKNIMLKSATDPYTLLKVIDFGVSKTSSCMQSIVGSNP